MIEPMLGYPLLNLAEGNHEPNAPGDGKRDAQLQSLACDEEHKTCSTK